MSFKLKRVAIYIYIKKQNRTNIKNIGFLFFALLDSSDIKYKINCWFAIFILINQYKLNNEFLMAWWYIVHKKIYTQYI